MKEALTKEVLTKMLPFMDNEQAMHLQFVLSFAKYVGGTVYISVGNPAVSKLIQATMDTPPAEGSRIRLFGIVTGISSKSRQLALEV